MIRLPARFQEWLPVVELRTHGTQTLTRDAIGLAATTDNQPLAPQLPEHGHGAIRQPETVAIEAIDLDNLAGGILDVANLPTLRECMQHPLFVL